MLEHEEDVSCKLGAALTEKLGRSEEHRRVAVVAACVHDAGPRGDVGNVVLLGDRQRVHVGSQGHGRAGSAAA